MSLVKAKDMPYETACLEKRIQFVHTLKSVLGRNSLISQTVELYTDLIEDILYDVCLDVHRDIVMGIERDALGRHGHDADDDHVVGSADRVDGVDCVDQAHGGVTNAELREQTSTRKRQARSPPGGRGRPGNRQQTVDEKKVHGDGEGVNKDVVGVSTTDGKDAESPTMEEMMKRAAIHYGSATMLGVQMSYVDDRSP